MNSPRARASPLSSPATPRLALSCSRLTLFARAVNVGEGGQGTEHMRGSRDAQPRELSSRMPLMCSVGRRKVPCSSFCGVYVGGVSRQGSFALSLTLSLTHSLSHSLTLSLRHPEGYALSALRLIINRRN